MTHYHVVSRVSIYILSAILIVLGVFHFLYPRELFLYIPPTLVGGLTWVYLAGGAYILVGISFLTNQFVKFTGYLLVIFLVIFIVLFHIPNFRNAGDNEMRILAFVNLMKDTAIAGFAMHVAAGAHHQHLHLENSD
jgi:putative oxidoreductase